MRIEMQLWMGVVHATNKKTSVVWPTQVSLWMDGSMKKCGECKERERSWFKLVGHKQLGGDGVAGQVTDGPTSPVVETKLPWLSLVQSMHFMVLEPCVLVDLCLLGH